MTYFLNLFTPETWAAFREHGATTSGFRQRQRRLATERVKPGDVFLCYLVRLSRWCGVLDVTSKAFIDDTPIFATPDPFVVRFHVKPRVLLDVETAIPMLEDEVWKQFSLTRGIEKGAVGWAAAYFRSSLRQVDKEDGDFLLDLLLKQHQRRKTFTLSERDRRQLMRKQTVPTVDREVAVEIPEGDVVEETTPDETAAPDELPEEARKSLQIQAAIARIGAEMGFRIWIPRNDKARVADLVPEHLRAAFLDNLPLNYDDNTLDTIKQIDVIWLKGRSMARAFEIEHTTAIYSGLLRMADLLALQPNMDIRLHIVAPDEKREKVKREIKRPVFSLLDRGPLYEKCTFLAYDAVHSLSAIKHLSHMSDTIVEEYEDSAEEA